MLQVLGIPYRILHVNQKKELQWSLEVYAVELHPHVGHVDTLKPKAVVRAFATFHAPCPVASDSEPSSIKP